MVVGHVQVKVPEDKVIKRRIRVKSVIAVVIAVESLKPADYQQENALTIASKLIKIINPALKHPHRPIKLYWVPIDRQTPWPNQVTLAITSKTPAVIVIKGTVQEWFAKITVRETTSDLGNEARGL